MDTSWSRPGSVQQSSHLRLFVCLSILYLSLWSSHDVLCNHYAIFKYYNFTQGFLFYYPLSPPQLVQVRIPTGPGRYQTVYVAVTDVAVYLVEKGWSPWSLLTPK